MSKVVTPSTAQPTQKIPHEKIAMRAYDKWVKKGKPQGMDVQNWLEAEAELKTEMTRSGPVPVGASQTQRR